MSTDPLDALDDELLTLVRSRAAVSDERREPDRDVVVALARRGLMRLVVPSSMGGGGQGPAELIELTRRVAYEHPSAGWVAMTCNEEATLASSYLSPASLARFYADEPAAVIAGSGVARGTATLTDDGCVVSGRWTYATGCATADYWMVVALIDEPSPRRMCAVVVPAERAWIDDTWHTLGMRGTGSADIVLEGVHVSADLLGIDDSLSLRTGENAQPPVPDAHPFFGLPSGLRFPFPKVGVAVGTAERAIAEFKQLASAKKPIFAKHTLAERPDAAQAVAHAEALVRSSYAFVTDELAELCATAERGEPIGDDQHARGRLACSWALRSCIEAVSRLASAAGATANATAPSGATAPAGATSLGSLLADVSAVAGHFMVGPQHIDTAGRVLLKQPANDPNF